MIVKIAKSAIALKNNNMNQSVSAPSSAYTPATKLGQAWYGLSRTEKMMYRAIGIGAALFVSYKTYKYFSDRAAQRDEQKASDAAKNEYQKLLRQGKVLSKPETNYRSTANLIEKLLDGCESASSEFQVIENIIKVVKKPIDWLYLVNVFGVRKISDCGSFGVSKTEYDLSTLLKDQLDTGGAYSIDVDGYKDSGFASDSIEVLRKYFSKIGISI